MAAIQWTEVDGVPTVWTQTSGPLFAALLFRAGRADETLVTTGQLHLIEHLVLSAIPDPMGRSNGFVSGVHTGFHSAGSPEEVAAFLARVCAGLSGLGGGRLEAERKILIAEAATQPRDVAGALLLRRFGPAGYGLLGVQELGLAGAALPQLQAAAAQRFTRENALLWLTGLPPAGLRLELPAGALLPPPPLQPLPLQLPRWFVDDAVGGFALSAMLPRSAAGTLLRGVLLERLRTGLRTEKALSYAPAVGYDPLSADRAHLVLWGDSVVERRAELSDAFCEILESLEQGLEADVARVRQLGLDGMAQAERDQADAVAVQALQRAVLDRALGRPAEPFAALRAELEATKADEVAALVKGLRGEALLCVPGKTKLRPWMGKLLAHTGGAPVEGPAVAHADAPLVSDRLVWSPQGVTVRAAGGKTVTVRFDALAGALSWSDGLLVLVGRDGAHLEIEPTLWRNGGRASREIRERVPAALRIDRGTRPAQQIPKPRTTLLQRTWARAGSAGPMLIVPVALVGLILLIGTEVLPGFWTTLVVVAVLALLRNRR